MWRDAVLVMLALKSHMLGLGSIGAADQDNFMYTHLLPGGVLDPKNWYIGSLPGLNPCSYLYNRVKYRGQNSTFRENIGVKTQKGGLLSYHGG